MNLYKPYKNYLSIHIEQILLKMSETVVEMSKEEKKKIEKREYMKEYMKKKRQNDPDFAEKQRAVVRKNLQNRYAKDAAYKEKKNKYDKERYVDYKEKIIKYKEAFDLMQSLSLNKE